MKKKVLYTVLLLVTTTAIILPLNGCKGFISGSGTLETKQYEISNYTYVEISSAFNYHISHSNFYSVAVTADDNILNKYVKVSKTGERLEVGLESDHVYNSLTIEVIITMPDLYSLSVSGASRGSVEGFSNIHDLIVTISGASSLDLLDISVGNVDFEISGASSLTGDLIAANTAVAVSGASNIQLDGNAQNLELVVSGASRAELSGFAVHNADASISGASRSTINLDGQLSADISGVSRLTYIGEPVFADIQTTGDSTLERE